MKQGNIAEGEEPAKTVKMSCYEICIKLFRPFARENGLTDYGAGTIESKDLHEDVDPAWDRIEIAAHDEYEAAVHTLESMILAHAMEGIDVTTPAYECGVETAMDAVVIPLR